MGWVRACAEGIRSEPVERELHVRKGEGAIGQNLCRRTARAGEGGRDGVSQSLCRGKCACGRGREGWDR